MEFYPSKNHDILNGAPFHPDLITAMARKKGESVSQQQRNAAIRQAWNIDPTEEAFLLLMAKHRLGRDRLRWIIAGRDLGHPTR